MNEDNKRTRKVLHNIATVEEFEKILNSTMLTEEERKILILHYRDGKGMAYIADELGLTEVSILKRHRKMLMKIGKAIGKM